MSQSAARAARRLAGRQGVRTARALHLEPHRSIAFPLEDAIRLNADTPLPGMAELLYSIRAEAGQNVMVAFCPECLTVDVFPL